MTFKLTPGTKDLKELRLGNQQRIPLHLKRYLESRSIDEFCRTAGKKPLLWLHLIDDKAFMSTKGKKYLNKFIRLPSKLFLAAKAS